MDRLDVDRWLTRLFDETLRFLADDDCFHQPTSPSIFIVYAHNTEHEDAKAEVVDLLNEWLVRIRSRTTSDRNPLNLWIRRSTSNSQLHDILTNQFCLLPARHSPYETSGDSERADKIILCGSPVLERYCRQPFASAYMQEIVNLYQNIIDNSGSQQYFEDEVRILVQKRASQDGFHHVLTELAFLQIRSTRIPPQNDSIVPITFIRDDISYLPFVNPTQVRLKLYSDDLAHRHLLFLRLLERLYEGALPSQAPTHELIKACQNFYRATSDSLSNMNEEISWEAERLIVSGLSRASRSLTNRLSALRRSYHRDIPLLHVVNDFSGMESEIKQNIVPHTASR